MIVHSIPQEIKMVEFLSSHPKLFRCGNTFNLEVVSLPKVLQLLRFLLLNNRKIINNYSLKSRWIVAEYLPSREAAR